MLQSFSYTSNEQGYWSSYQMFSYTKRFVLPGLKVPYVNEFSHRQKFPEGIWNFGLHYPSSLNQEKYNKSIAFLAFITNQIKEALSQIMRKTSDTLWQQNCYRLKHLFYKLQQKVIPNYFKKLLHIT